MVLNDDETGALKDLKPGHSITVVYEEPEDRPLIARGIEQRNKSYTGTIQAIDADHRTIKARGLLTEKKFHLADNCQIVVEGKLDGELRDLRIGDRVVFSYENADGVLVADRIGLDIGSEGDTVKAGSVSARGTAKTPPEKETAQTRSDGGL